MLIKTSNIIIVKGKLAGNYFQKDKSGLHIKALPRHIKRTKAGNLQTHLFFQEVTNAWRNFTFSTSQILSWNQYCNRHPFQNGIGEAYIPTFQLMFVRHNLIRVRNNLPIIYDPPAD